MSGDDQRGREGDEGGAARPAWPRWKKLAMALAGALFVTGVAMQGYLALAGSDARDPAAAGGQEMAVAGGGRTATGGDAAGGLAATSATGDATMRAKQKAALGLLPQGFLGGPLLGVGGSTFEPVADGGAAPRAATPVAGEAPIEATGEHGATPRGQAAAAAVSPILIESGISFFIGFCIAMALRAVAKVLFIVCGVGFLIAFGLQHAGIIAPIDWSALEGPFQSAVSAIGGWFERLQSYISHALPSGTMGGVGLAAGFKK